MLDGIATLSMITSHTEPHLSGQKLVNSTKSSSFYGSVILSAFKLLYKFSPLLGLFASLRILTISHRTV